MARFSGGSGGGSGAPGPMGPEGDSAYEIAVANGFEGTEQEWLDSLGGGGTADLGDFTFTENVASVSNNSSMILNATEGEAFDVAAQLVLNPSDPSATLLAKGSTQVWNYDSYHWSSATWTGEGNSSVLNINGASYELDYFLQNTWAPLNSTTNNTKISINDSQRGIFNGFSNSGTDYTIFIDGLTAPEDPTVGELQFTFNYVSKILIDHNESEMLVKAEDMDLYLLSDDDVYIKATGDDIHLEAKDDIRFIANRGTNEERNWRMDGGNGQFQFPGDGYISNPIDSSGDPSSPYNDTLHLVPDSSIGSDQYIILDPTNPNHIHIRAGGQIDESDAELYLGGEKTHVRVNDSSRSVSISSRTLQQSTTHQNLNTEASDVLLTGDVVSAVPGWTVEIDGVHYYIADVQVGEGTAIYVPGATFQPNGVYNLFSPDFSHTWNFDSEGIVYGPGDSGLTTFTKIHANSNDGSAQNIKIGDDAWIGDTNIANHIAITGVQDGTSGGIVLGGANSGTISVGEGDMSITSSGDMTISATGGDMNFWMDGAAYIGPSESENRIVQVKDLDNYNNTVIGQVVSYSATWSGDGLAYNGNPVTASYVKIGKLVQVQIDVEMDNVTNFGTGQYIVTLPFPSAYHTDVYGGSIHNTGATTEHYSIKGHLSPSSSAVTLWYISGSSQDMAFDHNSPINLVTTDKFHMAFSYICE